MATKVEPEFPSSPPNDDSDGDGQESVGEVGEVEEDKKPVNNNVADILKRLQSSGALIKKPKQEYHCFTCDEDFPDWEELENHLIQHVQLPSIVLDKLPSDDEDVDIPPSDEEDWSDEEETTPKPVTTPQKIDISQILKKTGLSLKKPSEEPQNSPNTALNKLTGLGFTIKKNNTPIKEEPADDKPSDIMQKLGKLGGIKLKLKVDNANSNSFKVVNGLKDFKTSDDEFDDEDEVQKEKNEEESDEEIDKSGENEKSAEDEDSPDEIANNKTPEKNNVLHNLKGKSIAANIEKVVSPNKPAPVVRSESTNQKSQQPLKPSGRPLIKQTPKRGANLPLPPRDLNQSGPSSVSSNSTPERSQSQESSENVVIKKEIDTESQQGSSVPLFSGQIKTERTSPPPSDTAFSPIVTKVKTEPEPIQETVPAVGSNQSNTTSTPVSSAAAGPPPPLLPVTKQETRDVVTVIEINGDSGDDDDDCCVVSATPASDVKPVIPKTEPIQSMYPTASYPASSQPSYTSSLSSSLPIRGSTEKQHSFNWNAPDSKPPIDILEKSADDMFQSLISSPTKKESTLSDASEYISLDTLGPQHSCEVCNTRFTSLSLLDDHKIVTGHSRSLVASSTGSLMPSSSASLMPYAQSSSILQSLLPVKQMVEQVGKLSAPGFTHQQNVMINIQAYPGAGGVMQPPQTPYNAGYGPGQNVPPGYPQSANMYGAPGQSMHDQYSNQNYMGQQNYGQYPSMPKTSYSGQMPPNSFDTSSYSNASPLQTMQQAYGPPPTSMNSQIGQMGPPPVPPSNQFVPSSSPGAMKPPQGGSGVRIQNIQTFPPGQVILGNQGATQATDHSMAPGQIVGGQMPAPGQIRMASGANMPGLRPRMPNILRGQRPTIRPGLQVHGQIRGAKPRMPMKRPANPPNMGMKKRPSLLLPRKHDNEDCQVMAMQKQRDGLPLIQSVQGANDKLNLGSQISITKKTVNKEASAMANVLASRGISVKQKQKSRSPTPERPIPHIPNLGAGVSIKHTSKSSNFSIPEAKVGGGMNSCKICNKMFMNQNSLAVHMSNAHPHSKVPTFKCDDCPAAYPKILQLQHHKRVFHSANSVNREFGLPVVDISQEDNLKRLSSLGIYSYIPLAGRDGGAGSFGIPIVNSHNNFSTSLQALGADGILSLGPMKTLPNS